MPKTAIFTGDLAYLSSTRQCANGVELPCCGRPLPRPDAAPDLTERFRRGKTNLLRAGRNTRSTKQSWRFPQFILVNDRVLEKQEIVVRDQADDGSTLGVGPKAHPFHVVECARRGLEKRIGHAKGAVAVVEPTDAAREAAERDPPFQEVEPPVRSEGRIGNVEPAVPGRHCRARPPGHLMPRAVAEEGRISARSRPCGFAH